MLEERRRRLLSAMTDGALWPADSPWVREAMEALPRDRFAPDSVWVWTGERYEAVHRADTPGAWAAEVHPDPYGSTVTQVTDGMPTSSISCAAVVATMLDSLVLEPGHRVLELGTGSGWNAALLAERAGQGQVTSIEIDAGLAAHARRRIEAAGHRVRVITGDGDGDGHSDGELPEDAAFDRVISTYAVERVPWTWVQRTRPGGRIVTPWGHTGCVALTVAQDGASATGWVQAPARFMPSRRTERPFSSFERVRDGGSGVPAAFPRSVQALSHPDVLFALRVLLPDVQVDTRAAGADGRAAAWLSDGRSSWAVLQQAGTSVNARRGGERDLADEATRAWTVWEERGSPGMYDFGLHITPDTQHVFTGDDPPGPHSPHGPHGPCWKPLADAQVTADPAPPPARLRVPGFRGP
ncbi:methyltransferase domain-containing protein [Streptomyces sp. NPDC007346]|uniref:methyltransferase domain-containing protein n=1 Tax=Streptomyces sp. NPDC007346 TaxID=3154682 RepID=UPI0034570193